MSPFALNMEEKELLPKKVCTIVHFLCWKPLIVNGPVACRSPLDSDHIWQIPEKFYNTLVTQGPKRKIDASQPLQRKTHCYKQWSTIHTDETRVAKQTGMGKSYCSHSTVHSVRTKQHQNGTWLPFVSVARHCVQFGWPLKAEPYQVSLLCELTCWSYVLCANAKSHSAWAVLLKQYAQLSEGHANTFRFSSAT